MNCFRLLLCLFCVTICSRANFINPGFETRNFNGWTLGGNSPASGVAVYGTAIFGGSVNVHSGEFAGFALVRCTDHCPQELITLSQVTPVIPNTTYSIGFFLGNDYSSVVGIDINDSAVQIFVDGTGLLFHNPGNLLPGSTPADMQLISGSFFSGDRTSVTATFQIVGSGSQAVPFSFDDFFVNETASAAPEPGTLMLVAMGLAICLLRASRSTVIL
jgi:hypothetical protein